MNLIGKREHHEFPHILQKWDCLNTSITSLIGLETLRSLNQRITHKYYHIRDVKKDVIVIGTGTKSLGEAD